MNLKKHELVEYIALGAKKLVELTYKGHRPSEEQQRVLINTAQSFGITFERAYNFGKSVSYHEYKAVANRFKKDELERIAKHIDDLILQVKAQEEEIVSYEGGDNYVPDEVMKQIACETRRGFLITYKEWVIANSTKILLHLKRLPDAVSAVVQIARGDLSINDYALSQLAIMKVHAETELARLPREVL